MLVVLSSGKLPEDTRTIREKGNYYVATLLPMVGRAHCSCFQFETIFNAYDIVHVKHVWGIVSACLKHMDFIISILVSLFEDAVLMYRGN